MTAWPDIATAAELTAIREASRAATDAMWSVLRSGTKRALRALRHLRSDRPCA